MNFREEKIEGKTLFEGKILRLQVDRVRLPDGRESRREVVRHSGGAAVLFVKEGAVLLVRQFRYAYGREMYEIPAGKLNAGEDPALAAARELEEETGYRAPLSHALDLYPTPGYTDEVIHLYFATQGEFVGQKPDDGEFVSCTFMPLEEALALIESGEICDAKTIVALYRYLLARRG